jgi:hypothetical protein
VIQKFWPVAVSIFILNFSPAFGQTPGAVVMKSVGEVAGEVVSSRAVQISSCLEQAIFKKGKIEIPEVSSVGFKKEVSGYLLELTVFKESQNFPVANVAATEVEKAVKEAQARLSSFELWQKLEVSPTELKANVERKLRSKRFIRFKADSSVVAVSNAEAEDYFEKNRIKFGDLPFENFKENIKAYLTRQQVEGRLRDWFEVLQNKYKVKNHLSDL